jgi:FXSXX-COOH protein
MVMRRQEASGGAALVDAAGLSPRDLDGCGESAIVQALRTVLEPGAAEAVAGFNNDPEAKEGR